MSKDILTILITTFLTVLGWIGFDIYHSAVDTTIPAEYSRIEPIEDYLDIEMLDVIEARQPLELYHPFEVSQ